MTSFLCVSAMVIAIRTSLNITVRLSQIAFACTILAVSLSLKHIDGDAEKFLNHPPTLLFVAAIGGLTTAGGQFGLALTWYTYLVKYGRVVDLLGIVLNLDAGSVSVCLVLGARSLVDWELLAVKVKWIKEDCPTQGRWGEMYNGLREAACGEGSKMSWLIGDKCENVGLRCRFSRIASILCFVVAALLLVTLAFGSFVKGRPGPPAVKASRATEDILRTACLTIGSESNAKTAML
ncbi:uncharacterized protein M421DRAFT_415187, partial [Didymella exigua CBS 183.55]